MTQGNNSITFEFTGGTDAGRVETLSDVVIKVGNHEQSHLRIEDPDVARMHAVIEVTDGEIYVIDLGSAAGTVVNGSKVNKALLVSGDVLQFGGTSVQVTIGAAAVEQVPQQAPAAAAPNPFQAPPAQAAPAAAPPAQSPFAAPQAAAAAPAAAAAGTSATRSRASATRSPRRSQCSVPPCESSASGAMSCLRCRRASRSSPLEARAVLVESRWLVGS